MEAATYFVTAVLVEGRSAREVAVAHGVSKSWVYELVARQPRSTPTEVDETLGAEGEAGLVARSRRPRRSPTKVTHCFEDDIVGVRKELVRRLRSTASQPSALVTADAFWRIPSRHVYG